MALPCKSFCWNQDNYFFNVKGKSEWVKRWKKRLKKRRKEQHLVDSCLQIAMELRRSKEQMKTWAFNQLDESHRVGWKFLSSMAIYRHESSRCSSFLLFLIHFLLFSYLLNWRHLFVEPYASGCAGVCSSLSSCNIE
jgi:hypothetical protein